MIPPLLTIGLTTLALLAEWGGLVIASLLAETCPGLENTSDITCIVRYASVMPLPFSRPSIKDNVFTSQDSFNGTTVADESFNLVHKATFLVFDTNRGLSILGPSPSLEDVFEVADVIHEGPVYIPSLNAIIVSPIDPSVVPQLIINLNDEPPTIANWTSDPPIYGVAGGRYFNNTIYFAAQGGENFTYNGTVYQQAPGIYSVDPLTRQATTLANNYYGQKFGGPDDLAIDPATGDVFFTDNWSALSNRLTDELPVTGQATYRWRRATGAVSIVETSITEPNGIGIDPTGNTLYITDTGIVDFNLTLSAPSPGYSIDARGPKSVYAFDLVDSPAGKYLVNKRVIWYPEQLVDDGFHVAADGTLVGAAGYSVDVLSPYGELLVKIQTDFYVVNVQFAGKELDELWLFGIGKISKVKWNLKGQSGEALS